MNKIKFSHDYKKLPEKWEGETAELLYMQKIENMDEFKKKFEELIDNDTKFRGMCSCGHSFNSHYEDGCYYEDDDFCACPQSGHYYLDFKVGIFLIFLHLPTLTIFSTIRRYTPEKFAYYQNNVHKNFKLIRTEGTEVKEHGT